jgi:hypothetical protein
MGIPILYAVGPASGTYTANTNANRIGAFLYAGGGGGGGGSWSPGGSGGVGGGGGYGFYNFPISSKPFSQPYSVGAPGNAGISPQFTSSGGSGGSGGNTNLTNVGTVNAGGGGPGANPGSNQPAGPDGSQPGASLTYPARNFIVGRDQSGPGAFGGGGNQGNGGNAAMEGGANPTNSGTSGGSGVLVIFENTGT